MEKEHSFIKDIVTVCNHIIAIHKTNCQCPICLAAMRLLEESKSLKEKIIDNKNKDSIWKYDIIEVKEECFMENGFTEQIKRAESINKLKEVSAELKNYANSGKKFNIGESIALNLAKEIDLSSPFFQEKDMRKLFDVLTVLNKSFESFETNYEHLIKIIRKAMNIVDSLIRAIKRKEIRNEIERLEDEFKLYGE